MDVSVGTNNFKAKCNAEVWCQTLSKRLTSDFKIV